MMGVIVEKTSHGTKNETAHAVSQHTRRPHGHGHAPRARARALLCASLACTRLDLEARPGVVQGRTRRAVCTLRHHRSGVVVK
eukprot:1792299-Prymnesium_polylepis.1